ncbi:hypothetical protein MBM_03827 [Drepanopeziza brunnea f. sp. 'multigermtubi' MB_m1]|uniref:Uncharacterized protein n=1 Tax=Marssonina brunnea f. sp. multigermtubi (strain MB_m1) TaxID=1072389 RepID=K1WK35_MARBU|nr:uncharacterized protein MBM_03827 [Drepanopeziza brunnea f. sp. 'multigermtubi' MB_m1]EKD18055.1 hypothetical protein MBM_03827 [Drepanopeziza brunnea f. sp. 'multigermtubi' MB_m1]
MDMLAVLYKLLSPRPSVLRFSLLRFQQAQQAQQAQQPQYDYDYETKEQIGYAKQIEELRKEFESNAEDQQDDDYDNDDNDYGDDDGYNNNYDDGYDNSYETDLRAKVNVVSKRSVYEYEKLRRP